MPRHRTNEPKEQLGDFQLDTSYSKNDLSKLSIFKGEYINFGYWKGIAISRSNKMGLETRIKGSEQLYQLVFDKLSIERGDRVLEVGCGKGMGCAQLMKGYRPCQLIGMDLFKRQTARAIELHRKFLKGHPALKFKTGRAEKMPFEDGHFTKLYSVEAAQHFESTAKFAREAHRVLAENGIVCVTTFFASKKDAEARLAKVIPSIPDGADKLRFIDDVLRQFRAARFGKIKCTKIGRHVFKGFDIWMEQNGFHDSWGRRWLEAYEAGLIDYYVITARKS